MVLDSFFLICASLCMGNVNRINWYLSSLTQATVVLNKTRGTRALAQTKKSS